jgi:dienelactone hydrolase
MKSIIILLAIPVLVFSQQKQIPMQKVTFPASDGLIVTADIYTVNDTLPYMVLCHQARYSRGEYMETVKEFCDMGYNCLVPDLRSGKEVNGVYNETASLAIKKGLSGEYLDAEPDMIAAINYAYQKSGKKVVLVGSSYSASLALKIAATNKKVSAVLAFSPGEYFGDKLNLKKVIAEIGVPVFTTSSKDESASVTELITDIKPKIKVHFIPTSAGKHGSSALWKNNPNNQEYWTAVKAFMSKLKT